MVVLTRALLFICALALSGCFAVGTNSRYKGPETRPPEIENYYSVGRSVLSSSEEIIDQNDARTWKRITIQTEWGPTVVDFFERPQKTQELVIVFPILGGRNTIFEYFAENFVKNGYDSAIIHRNNDFKDPAQFDNLEEILRQNVIRDRIVLDFFERSYGKSKFGSFGISRGGINVVMTAGADSRLKYNVVALGGEDLARMMRESNELRFIKYRQAVKDSKGITDHEFFRELRKHIKTDPKYLAKYVDAKSTLMFLGLFDSTVPIQYGVKLRRRLGGPKTVYLLADHYIAAGFTGVAEIASPAFNAIGFPFDYIESESLQFYNSSMRGEGGIASGLLPFKVLQAPFNLLADIVDELF